MKPSLRCAFLLVGGLAWLGGCASHSQDQAGPLSPEKNAAGFTARTLGGEELRQFLAQNLGHEPSPWPPAAWDFETLAWVAFYYHPSLEVARAQWAGARAAQLTAAARPNPTLSFTPGYSTNAPAGTSPWFPAVNLDFLLETSSRREQRTAVENFSAEAARLNVLATAWQVRTELRRALIEATAAAQRSALLHDQLEIQRQLGSLFEQRLQAGAVPASEVAVARTMFLRTGAAAADADGQMVMARSRVAAALGLPLAAIDALRFDAPLVTPRPPLTGEALASARRQSLQSRADVLGALARYNSALAGWRLAAAKRYPDVHLGPGYQWDQGQNKWTLGLTVELPLFHQNEGPMAEALARCREAAAQFNATQALIIGAIDQATAGLAAATAQLDQVRRLQAESARQAGFVQARLAAGSADRMDLHNSELELLTVRFSTAEAESAAARAAGELEDALQVPFANLAALAPAGAAATPPPVP